MPPGTPDEIVRLYQKAFLETLRDPQLLAEAKKSKIEVNPIDGPTIAKLMADLYKMDPALLSQLREILVPKKG
jgi:hypothetical protein